MAAMGPGHADDQSRVNRVSSLSAEALLHQADELVVSLGYFTDTMTELKESRSCRHPQIHDVGQ